MFNLSLTACSFHLQKLNSKRNNNIFLLNRINNGDIEGFPHDIFDLFSACFTRYSQPVKDEGKKQSFHFDVPSMKIEELDEYRMLYIRVESGIYGSSSSILDGETRRLKYEKMASDIEERPFYFFVIVPKDSDRVTVEKGMFIFQNIGPYGIKTVTTDYLQDFFSNEFNIALKCRTIAADLFVRKVIHPDRIKKLLMVKNIKSGDSADNQTMGYGKEVRELGNLHFNHQRWDDIMDKIRWVAGGRYNLFEFENQRYDTLKVVVDIGVRIRTIDLHNLDNLSIIEAIPDEIRMADGHPDVDLLVDHMKDVASEYLSEMVLQIS